LQPNKLKTLANLIHLKSVESHEGVLAVFEHLMPGHIERVYFINSVPANIIRGGHRHKATWQGLVCLSGSCKVYIQEDIDSEKTYILSNPYSCLLLKPTDWHQMYEFSSDAILLVLANQNYDPDDYIDEPYQAQNTIKNRK
jgi:dTDP-4-dehydrorhamnose 3,5-epimerase-like enzyme